MDSPNLEADTRESKRRKVLEKTVVTLKIEAGEGKKKSEGPPPSDNWSWRKYGQKPIKGSPFPRGYYRCSTSKGCLAKKQVERCKNDASMLVITYTSTHNHPIPDITTTKHLKQNKSSPNKDPFTPPKQEQEEDEQQQTGDGSGNENEVDNENHFHYCQSPFNYSNDIMINQKENPFGESIENIYGSLGVIFDEEPLGCPLPLINFSKIKSEEYDFYDELEELPTWSIFMKKDLFDERILVPPS